MWVGTPTVSFVPYGGLPNVNKEEFKKYQEDRYQDQIRWYARSSRKNKRYYSWFQWVAIVLSASIPVFVITLDGDYNWITATLSVVLAIVTTGLKTFKFQENWLNYRTISETLKKEKYYYNAGLFEYATAGNMEQMFVTRVERIISTENTLWISTHTRKENKKKNKGDESWL